jgi:hypothetical protein
MAEVAANPRPWDKDFFEKDEGAIQGGLKENMQQAAGREIKSRKRQALKKAEKFLIKKMGDKLGFDESDLEDELGQEGGASTKKKTAQAISRILLKRRRKAAIKLAKRKARAKIAQKMAKQGILRVVATAAGATMVGLIVTYLLMTIQAIAGNLLGSKWIPKLNSLGDKFFWWELPTWIAVSLLMFAVLIVLVFIGILAVAFTPTGALLITGMLVKSLIGL